MGIEPTWPVWKTGTLPLSYARLNATQCSREASLVNGRPVMALEMPSDATSLCFLLRRGDG